MVEETPQTNLADGVTRFLESLKTDRGDAQQHLAKFVQWFGRDRPVNALKPVDMEHYSARTGAGAGGDAGTLRRVRDFLTYARKSGFLVENLALHVKVPKAARSKPGAQAGAAQATSAIWLTQQGYDQLQERLVWLQEEMVNAAAEIKKAAADKDVRENAPLEAARAYLGQLDGRRREAEEALRLAQVIGEDGGAGAGVVRQGGSITLLDVSTGQSQQWLLVDPREAAPLDGRLSTTSPVGQAVLGRRKGDEVNVSAPRGMVRYKIVQAQ